MKKLLLIALTIPNFALAENFKLVCEGQISKFRNDALEKTYKTTQVIEVNDDFIVIDSVTYKSKTFNYGAVKGSSKYIKDDALIRIETVQVTNDCDKILLNVKLNRSSGMIESTAERIGTCDGSDFTTATKFKGKCK